MAFAGTWKRTGAENPIPIMKHVGMPDEVIEALKGTETTMVIEAIDKNSYKETFTAGGKTTVTTKSSDKESELIDWRGDKFTVVPKSIGKDKVRVEYDFKGVHYIAVRELVDGNTIIDHVDLDNGKVVGKFIYTKQ